MPHRSRLSILVIFLVCAVGTVHAQDRSGTEKKPARLMVTRWNVGLGGIAATFETAAALSLNLVGTRIRLESDLGLEKDDESPRLEAFYRLSNKSRIGFSVADFSRSGESVATVDFSLGENIEIIAGAQVVTNLDTTYGKLDYKYAFVNDGRTEAGLSAGLSFVDIGLDIAGRGIVAEGDAPPETKDFETGFSIALPVPVFGMFINHGITPNLILRIRADFFELSVNGNRGRILDTGVSFEYYFSKYVGIGGGFTGTDLNYRDTSSDIKNI
jgi:hypothetical protein